MTNLPNDSYSINDIQTQCDYLGERRAERWVGFLLPFLKPGMNVLDCGCGVGTITIDLAERVVPGKVVGIDADEKQLQLARDNARKRGITNVEFIVYNVYDMAFTNETFDVVMAHTLMFHLSDPIKALVEMHRVLNKGGIIGVSDDDWNSISFSPDDPMFRKVIDLASKGVKANGGNPFYSRHLRNLLLQAGFTKTEGHSVAAECYGNLQETQRFAKFHSNMLRNAEIRELVKTEKWATETEMDEMADYMLKWGDRPDAFCAILYCAAIGWKSLTDNESELIYGK